MDKMLMGFSLVSGLVGDVKNLPHSKETSMEVLLV